MSLSRPDAMNSVRLRPATPTDAALLHAWDREPHVIRAVTDDPTAEEAFIDADWEQEIRDQSAVSYFLIGEENGRPVGAMQVIDPHLEPTHYWGGIEPNLRALDIWLGPADALGRGIGAAMMTQAIDACFADAEVTAIVIDPLASNADAHRFYRRLGFRPLERRLFGPDECLVHRLERAEWEARS
ncbi:GNAT family N-acetyltransferase [Brevundimonas sp.]|uniref:GNAT family N-acetyltransferase n=1 Tax=Brevundimonas sp. TaxID=1871086 RepID=UPI0039E3CADD